LTLKDVGKHIELVYTPIRKDGAKGSSQTILSNVIAPGESYFHNLGFTTHVYNLYMDFNIFEIIAYNKIKIVAVFVHLKRIFGPDWTAQIAVMIA
jgi:hypothetical protein